MWGYPGHIEVLLVLVGGGPLATACTLINMRGNLIWYYCVLYMGSPCYQPVQKISKFWFHLGQG